MTAHIETDLPAAERTSVYEEVLADLDRDVRPYLELIRSEFDRMGIFEELRRDSELPPDRRG